MSVEPRSTARNTRESYMVVCDVDTATFAEVRHLLRDLVGGRDDMAVQDALLVTDELVSNARRHGLGPRQCRLALIDGGRRLLVEVDDASFAPPRKRTPDLSGGRGLILIDRLAASWGVQYHADHKTVWAELVLDGPGNNRNARHLGAIRASTSSTTATGH
ncbi:ATP-binding protein [Kibdelosporangium aridum]|uniref:ATP-binding protein n=1 Tax=Kibdelosporangium aridum TaxID=2030 RepID=A0A428ZIR7_KIBAR|nr:ATP-binding protein [Kibdelosporangium aridum]RSM87955.1 ATP-binding protein [Kibdelosporangium aridum]